MDIPISETEQITISETEQIDDVGFGGLRLIQDRNGFRYGIDAVLLAGYAADLAPGSGSAADLGCGNGVIPLILSHKCPGIRITGFEIQPQAADLAKRSVRMNGLEDRIDIRTLDVVHLSEDRSLRQAFDLVVTNPPYVPRDGGLRSSNPSIRTARQETTADLEDFIRAASRILKDRGHFCMIHRPYRLVDLLGWCREYKLEPKDLQLVTPRRGAEPNLVLIHCIRGGGRELRVRKQLEVYEENGLYTSSIMEIYERNVKKHVENISKLCDNERDFTGGGE